MGQILGPEYAAGQILMDAITVADSTDPQKIVRRDRRDRRRVRLRPGQVRRQPHVGHAPSIWTQWQNRKSDIIWPEDMAANGKPIFPLP